LYRIILWDHRSICGPSLTETSLCYAYLYLHSGSDSGLKDEALSGCCRCRCSYRCRLLCGVGVKRPVLLLYRTKEKITYQNIKHISSLHNHLWFNTL